MLFIIFLYITFVHAGLDSFPEHMVVQKPDFSAEVAKLRELIFGYFVRNPRRNWYIELPKKDYSLPAIKLVQDELYDRGIIMNEDFHPGYPNCGEGVVCAVHIPGCDTTVDRCFRINFVKE